MKKSTINIIGCIANGLDARRHLPRPTNSMPTSVLSIKLALGTKLQTQKLQYLKRKCKYSR